MGWWLIVTSVFKFKCCDRCGKTNQELSPLMIAGEEFLVCYNCYQEICEGGMKDG
jgi:hypothetical protein